jgi:ABC-type branched-subunit amino acid transport system ATPase component
MSDRDILVARDVSSGYGAVAVVRSVNLALGAGEALAVLGKNGMGKTTLLKTIVGLLPLQGGAIRIAGADAPLSPADLVAKGVSYAPQDQPLFQDLSVRDNLRLALRRDAELGPALERAVGYFPFLAERLSQRAGTLSGGEQKMLILARALMLKPRLVLIDEISEGLQPSVLHRIAGVLREEISREGVAILMVEQNLDFALSVAQRWAVLERGEIRDEGRRDEGARERISQQMSL